jgi:hypothetical protein
MTCPKGFAPILHALPDASEEQIEAGGAMLTEWATKKENGYPAFIVSIAAEHSLPIEYIFPHTCGECGKFRRNIQRSDGQWRIVCETDGEADPGCFTERKESDEQ